MAKGSTTARGYGAQHQRLRKAMLHTAVGSACTRCGKPITSTNGIDLDHNDDGDGYLGFAHSSCNRSAGAIKGNDPGPSGTW